MRYTVEGALNCKAYPYSQCLIIDLCTVNRKHATISLCKPVYTWNIYSSKNKYICKQNGDLNKTIQVYLLNRTQLGLDLHLCGIEAVSIQCAHIIFQWWAYWNCIINTIGTHKQRDPYHKQSDVDIIYNHRRAIPHSRFCHSWKLWIVVKHYAMHAQRAQ